MDVRGCFLAVCDQVATNALKTAISPAVEKKREGIWWERIGAKRHYADGSWYRGEKRDLV